MSLEELVRPDLARQEAEEAARNLAHQAERLGLPLEDIEITAPCPTCRRTAYTIHLGTLDPAQTRQLADALRTLPRSNAPQEKKVQGSRSSCSVTPPESNSAHLEGTC